MSDYFKYEKILKTKWGYLVCDSSMGPTRIHEVQEEIQQKEKELGFALLLQKDKEGRYL